jgi:LmbE family N-acetylglucosaminyl deacetylase
MATAIFFHAHPDDETLFTGGTMARAAAEGHRVVLVTATRGERGHDHGGVLSPGEKLADRRAIELQKAGQVLGVARYEWLGYADSGADPASVGRERQGPAGAPAFADVTVQEAALRLAEILAEEKADVLTTYDDRGGYGHPDHVQAHRVANLAARLSRADHGMTPSVYWATFDRDRIRNLVEMAGRFGLEIDDEVRAWTERLGVAGERISSTVDVGDWIDHKRRAMGAHATQFPASSWLMTLPTPAFQLLFGTEWYIEPAAVGGRTWIFDD